jgi:hypothetical protein
MIHVYALVEGLERLPEVEGVGGAPLELLELGGPAVVVASRGPRAEADEEQALAHGRVVEALMESASAVLPVRFGPAVPDEQALARLLAERGPALREALARVRGCVEVGLRVWGDRAVADRLHDRLAQLVRDSRVRRAEPTELVAAYLVPRGLLAAVRNEVERVLADGPDRAVLCTGPWAPYSFAEAA